MRLALALLAALPAAPALADAVTFVGTLGGRDIVVELTQPSDGAVAGRFAYLDTGGDVPLVPVSHDGNRWVLQEEAPCGEDDCVLADDGTVLEAPIAAIWELAYEPESYLAFGTRRSAGGKAKQSPLALSVVAWRPLEAGEAPTARALHERSFRAYYDDAIVLDWPGAPYEMALLEVPPEAGETRRMGGASYRYVTDPRTRFAFPRAVAFAGGEPVEPVNAILARRHYRMSLAALDCLAYRYASYGAGGGFSGMGGTLGDYDGEQVTLTYLSPRVVSWTQSGSLWCAGAHPYNHHDSHTYDVAAGTALPLEKIFSAWVPREWGGAPEAIVAPDAADADRVYNWGPSPALIAYVRDRLPAELLFEDPETDAACYGEQALADQLDIRFAAPLEAVFTLSGFPHVLSVCNGDLFSVPLSELREFLGPEAAGYFPELAE